MFPTLITGIVESLSFGLEMAAVVLVLALSVLSVIFIGLHLVFCAWQCLVQAKDSANLKRPSAASFARGLAMLGALIIAFLCAAAKAQTPQATEGYYKRGVARYQQRPRFKFREIRPPDAGGQSFQTISQPVRLDRMRHESMLPASLRSYSLP